MDEEIGDEKGTSKEEPLIVLNRKFKKMRVSIRSPISTESVDRCSSNSARSR